VFAFIKDCERSAARVRPDDRANVVDDDAFVREFFQKNFLDAF
jgi:hypothetical protein